jgi:hypothetical protein
MRSRLSFEPGVSTIVLILFVSCGGSPSPSSPTAPAGSIDPSAPGVAGQVLETVSRRPVAGALVEFPGGSTRTDASGSFRIPSTSVVIPVAVTAGGHVTRKSFVGSTSSSPLLDVIETGSLWNLDFYRELARNGAGGGKLELLNPWTIEPSFYIDRSPESGSARAIPDSAVRVVVDAIGAVLPLLTRGELTGDRIETGTTPPADKTPGTVVIRWDPVEIAHSAGAASGITLGVGGNASVVVLRSIEETGVIYHELGHVLGLYHPLGGIRPSHMFGSGRSTPPYFTDWDVFHANVLYSRPPGNSDVDNDPSGFLAGAKPSTTLHISDTVIVCRFP